MYYWQRRTSIGGSLRISYAFPRAGEFALQWKQCTSKMSGIRGPLFTVTNIGLSKPTSIEQEPNDAITSACCCCKTTMMTCCHGLRKPTTQPCAGASLAPSRWALHKMRGWAEIGGSRPDYLPASWGPHQLCATIVATPDTYMDIQM